MLMSTISGPGYSSAPPLYGLPTSSQPPLYGRFGCVGCGPRGLNGLNGGIASGATTGSSAAIQELQNALVGYAQAFGLNAEVNPVNTSGQLNDETVLGTLYVVYKASDSIPGISSIKSLINKIP